MQLFSTPGSSENTPISKSCNGVCCLVKCLLSYFLTSCVWKGQSSLTKINSAWDPWNESIFKCSWSVTNDHDLKSEPLPCNYRLVGHKPVCNLSIWQSRIVATQKFLGWFANCKSHLFIWQLNKPRCKNT